MTVPRLAYLLQGWHRAVEDETLEKWPGEQGAHRVSFTWLPGNMQDRVAVRLMPYPAGSLAFRSCTSPIHTHPCWVQGRLTKDTRSSRQEGSFQALLPRHLQQKRVEVGAPPTLSCGIFQGGGGLSLRGQKLLGQPRWGSPPPKLEALGLLPSPSCRTPFPAAQELWGRQVLHSWPKQWVPSRHRQTTSRSLLPFQ